MWKNKLYFGDCLEILMDLYDKNKEGFIDLVYIDPPFNSKRNYNILFEEADLSDTKAQREAFADTWSNVTYKDTLNTIKSLDLDLYNFLNALDQIRISKSAIAYLTTMAIRIHFIHKVLKSTGSFYLHCDPTMSHYLKLVCDLIFGSKMFRNEIIWKRKSGVGESNSESNRFGQMHDVILFFAKGENNSFYKELSREIAEDYIKERFTFTDENGRQYMRSPLNSPSDRPNLKYEYKGYKPSKFGWSVSLDVMKKMDSEGRLYFPENKNQRIYRKIFFEEYKGQPIQSIWSDIPFINPMAKERLGYPTQKPEALLERIIKACTKEGDIVADFFCGCGTSIAAAQKLNRKWLGVDISHLAIGLIERRLKDTYGSSVKETYEVHGFPKDISSARKLSTEGSSGRFEFQKWIIEAELGGICNPKKTADGGWDGHLTFNMQEEKKVVIVEVKSGNVNVKNLREFIHVVKTQNADIGVFVCFADQVTKPMTREAKDQGYFEEQFYGDRYDRIQILTVDDILEGKNIQFPDSRKQTFKKAERKSIDESKQGLLEL